MGTRGRRLAARRGWTRWLACLAAAAVICMGGAAPGLAQGDTPVDLELVIAVDISRSIDLKEARLQRDGYIEALRDREVIEAIESGILGRIAVGYFEWAGFGHHEIIVDWTLIDTAADALEFSNQLTHGFPKSASRTSISSAISFGQSWFNDNGFEGTRRVIDVSGDGPNNWGELVTVARDRAVAEGVVINGLPILDRSGGLFARFHIDNLDLYYRNCVIGGEGAFIVTAEGHRDFARAVRRKLVLEIAGRQPDPGIGHILVQTGRGLRASPPCNIGEIIWGQRDQF